MYIQKRKTLEDRINQVINRMASIPEDEFAATLHFEDEFKKNDEPQELRGRKIRNKRTRLLKFINIRDIQKTENQSKLINLYEQLILVEDEEQLENDEANFKNQLLQHKLNLDSLILAQTGYLTTLLSEKQTKPDLSEDVKDEFYQEEYSLPDLLLRTEEQIALYNRGVEESRKVLKNISSRYPSDVLSRWENEFLQALEEERRQLSMTL